MRVRTRRDWLVVSLLFACAFLLRVGVAFELRTLPASEYLVMDARQYDNLAVQIGEGGWLPREPFYQAPLYPYFLAAIYSISGHSYTMVRLAQACLGSLVALLLGLTARHAFGRAAGYWTLFFASFYGPLVFFVEPLLKPILASFFLSLMLWSLITGAYSAKTMLWRLGLSGLALGAAILVRENFLLLLPTVLCFLIWRRRRAALRTMMKPAAVFGVGVIVALLPALLANHHASGQWILVSSQGGMNFYIGNARGANGLYRALTLGSQKPEAQKQDAARLAAALRASEMGVDELEEPLKEGEISRVFWRESFRQIGENPLEWVALMGRKTLYFWNRFEVPGAESYQVARRHSRILRLAFFDFGLLGPLAILGLFLAGPEERSPALLSLGLALTIAVSVVLFFIFGRYRLPVVPFLLPLSGLALGRSVTWLRRKQAKEIAAGVLALALATALVWYPAFPAALQKTLEVSPHFNQGMAANHLALRAYLLAEEASEPLERDLHLEEAEVRARQAVAFLQLAAPEASSFPVGQIERGVAESRLGNLLLLTQREDEALQAYRQAEKSLGHALSLELRPELQRQAEAVLKVVQGNLRLVSEVQAIPDLSTP